MNKHKFDIEKAEELRTQGKTYRQISLEMGCSIAWCKKNLANIEPGGHPDAALIAKMKEQTIEILQDALKKARAL